MSISLRGFLVLESGVADIVADSVGPLLLLSGGWFLGLLFVG